MRWVLRVWTRVQFLYWRFQQRPIRDKCFGQLRWNSHLGWSRAKRLEGWFHPAWFGPCWLRRFLPRPLRRLDQSPCSLKDPRKRAKWMSNTIHVVSWWNNYLRGKINIMLSQMFFAGLTKFQCYEFETSLFEPLDDFSDQAALDSIRLDCNKSSLFCCEKILTNNF